MLAKCCVCLNILAAAFALDQCYYRLTWEPTTLEKFEGLWNVYQSTDGETKCLRFWTKEITESKFDLSVQMNGRISHGNGTMKNNYFWMDLEGKYFGDFVVVASDEKQYDWALIDTCKTMNDGTVTDLYEIITRQNVNYKKVDRETEKIIKDLEDQGFTFTQGKLSEDDCRVAI